MIRHHHQKAGARTVNRPSTDVLARLAAVQRFCSAKNAVREESVRQDLYGEINCLTATASARRR